MMYTNMGVVLDQLGEWYNLLDMVERADVDALIVAGKFDELFNKYHTAPGFPTKETAPCL